MITGSSEISIDAESDDLLVEAIARILVAHAERQSLADHSASDGSQARADLED